MKLFNVFSHHYSYAVDQELTISEEKKQRNLVLLEEELREKPEDIRTAYHLMQEYSRQGKLEEHFDLVEEWYFRVKKERSNPYYPCIYKYMAVCLVKKNKIKKAIETMREFIEQKDAESLWDIDFYILWAKTSFVIKDYDAVIDVCDRALGVFERVANESDDLLALFVTPACANKEGKSEIIELKAQAYMSKNDLNQSLQILRNLY